MSEEKKLTDEEVIKALGMNCLCVAYGKENCESCLLFEKDCRFLPNAVVDLIHRLQAEKEEIKNEYVKLDLECQKLKTENEELKSSKFANWKVKFFKAQEELDKEYALRLAHQFACEKKELEKKQLELENAELQKQANDWKERAKIDLKNERNWSKIQIKQAVKDTAKEIFEKIFFYRNRNDTTNFDNILLNMAKDYGVEVE